MLQIAGISSQQFISEVIQRLKGIISYKVFKLYPNKKQMLDWNLCQAINSICSMKT